MLDEKCNRLAFYEENLSEKQTPKITNIQAISAKEGTLLLSKWTPQMAHGSKPLSRISWRRIEEKQLGYSLIKHKFIQISEDEQ